jgi:UDP-glucose 4-epimerase
MPSASFKRAAELFTGTVGQGSHFETLNLRIGTVWGPLGDPDSPFLPIPRLIDAAAHGEAPDLVPPRPAGSPTTAATVAMSRTVPGRLHCS